MSLRRPHRHRNQLAPRRGLRGHAARARGCTSSFTRIEPVAGARALPANADRPRKHLQSDACPEASHLPGHLSAAFKSRHSRRVGFLEAEEAHRTAIVRRRARVVGHARPLDDGPSRRPTFSEDHHTSHARIISVDGFNNRVEAVPDTVIAALGNPRGRQTLPRQSARIVCGFGSACAPASGPLELVSVGRPLQNTSHHAIKTLERRRRPVVIRVENARLPLSRRVHQRLDEFRLHLRPIDPRRLIRSAPTPARPRQAQPKSPRSTASLSLQATGSRPRHQKPVKPLPTAQAKGRLTDIEADWHRGAAYVGMSRARATAAASGRQHPYSGCERLIRPTTRCSL